MRRVDGAPRDAGVATEVGVQGVNMEENKENLGRGKRTKIPNKKLLDYVTHTVVKKKTRLLRYPFHHCT